MRRELTFACGNYDRTQGLIDGTIKPEGLELNWLTIPHDEMWSRMDRFLAVGKVTTMAEGTEKVAGKATYAADKIFPQIVWGKAVRSEFPINGLCENLFRALRLGSEPALSSSKWWADGTQFLLTAYRPS